MREEKERNLSKSITSEEAIENILRFVYDSEEDELDDDLHNLNGEENDFIYKNEKEEIIEELQEVPRYRKQLKR